MTVYVSGRVQGRNKYHTKMCYNAQEIGTIREVSQTEAEKMGLERCRICSGNRESNIDNDWSYQNALRDARND